MSMGQWDRHRGCHVTSSNEPSASRLNAIARAAWSIAKLCSIFSVNLVILQPMAGGTTRHTTLRPRIAGYPVTIPILCSAGTIAGAKERRWCSSVSLFLAWNALHVLLKVGTVQGAPHVCLEGWLARAKVVKFRHVGFNVKEAWHKMAPVFVSAAARALGRRWLHPQVAPHLATAARRVVRIASWVASTSTPPAIFRPLVCLDWLLLRYHKFVLPLDQHLRRKPKLRVHCGVVLDNWMCHERRPQVPPVYRWPGSIAVDVFLWIGRIDRQRCDWRIIRWRDPSKHADGGVEIDNVGYLFQISSGGLNLRWETRMRQYQTQTKGQDRSSPAGTRTLGPHTTYDMSS
eukprot:COSAG02_NODE_215_length_28614_cov_43.077047_1_plen_345_part_00